MSFLDKIASAVMPPESEEDRAKARAEAQQLARDNAWLAMALDHHRQIEAAFAQGLDPSTDLAGRREALKHLATVLNGHSLAEEVVLYPALVEAGGKVGATMAYEEQSMTKVQMHKLEHLDPMSHEWREKLEHIQGAVLHHIYEEESAHFPKIVEHCAAGETAMLTQRFAQEFERYASGTEISEPLSQPA
jgi:iron-sulfur cluster repair protein YtfE (RIC family)